VRNCKPFPIGFGSDVELEEGRAERFRKRFARLDIDVGDDNGCTFGSERFDDGSADSARSSSDEGRFIL
jgi:hypothetical protein